MSNRSDPPRLDFELDDEIDAAVIRTVGDPPTEDDLARTVRRAGLAGGKPEGDQNRVEHLGHDRGSILACTMKRWPESSL